jgi:aquaporin Z
MAATEPPNDLIFHYVVEAIGTLCLIFMGAAAIIMTGGDNLVAIGFAHGLAIALMVAATGHISGGAFNPAVVLALLIARKISVVKAALYVVSQLVGATIGAALLTLVFDPKSIDKVNLGVPAVGKDFTSGNALVAEIITTFFLTYVIFGVAVDKRGPSTIAALCIGLTIAMDIFATGAVSGAAMNPARWFGPAVVSGHFENAWVWWVGPAIGAAVAAALYYFGYLRGRDD